MDGMKFRCIQNSSKVIKAIVSFWAIAVLTFFGFGCFFHILDKLPLKSHYTMWHNIELSVSVNNISPCTFSFPRTVLNEDVLSLWNNISSFISEEKWCFHFHTEVSMSPMSMSKWSSFQRSKHKLVRTMSTRLNATTCQERYYGQCQLKQALFWTLGFKLYVLKCHRNDKTKFHVWGKKIMMNVKCPPYFHVLYVIVKPLDMPLSRRWLHTNCPQYA